MLARTMATHGRLQPTTVVRIPHWVRKSGSPEVRKSCAVIVTLSGGYFSFQLQKGVRCAHIAIFFARSATFLQPHLSLSLLN